MVATVLAVQFRVHGRVQGVFFRKFTKLEADKLGIKGFVKNESDGTVIGEGQSASVESMEAFKHFLERVGSPNSEIASCDFTMRKVDGYDYTSFEIIR
ncbi:putative acylphosphatase [Babesia divergens]|uniref:acylphosphatase n=1 Tax=Babesia divergens TaxID=32595 RepID=A0AAD9LGY2_BABDI|nr:putative acylphosphatase [Babesia divergens]